MKKDFLIFELECLNCYLTLEYKTIKKIFPKVIIPNYVYLDLKPMLGDDSMSKIKKLIRNNYFVLEDIDLFSPEFSFYKKLINGNKCQCRGKSEASAICIARKNDYIILSKRLNDYSEFNIDNMNLSDYLLDLFKENKIKREEACLIWERMCSHNININEHFLDDIIKKSV